MQFLRNLYSRISKYVKAVLFGDEPAPVEKKPSRARKSSAIKAPKKKQAIKTPKK